MQLNKTEADSFRKAFAQLIEATMTLNVAKIQLTDVGDAAIAPAAAGGIQGMVRYIWDNRPDGQGYESFRDGVLMMVDEALITSISSASSQAEGTA